MAVREDCTSPAGPPASRADGGHGAAEESRWLFGAVYGTLLASILTAALAPEGQRPDPVYDVAWIVITMVAVAFGHAYSHIFAAQTASALGWRSAPRALAREWPLLVAGIPAVAILLPCSLGEYSEQTAVPMVLGVNVAALLGWGIVSALRAGYRPVTSMLVGVVDAGFGMLIIVANVLVK